MNASSEPNPYLTHTWTSLFATVIKAAPVSSTALSDEDKRPVEAGARVEGQLAGEASSHWIVNNATLDGKVLAPHLTRLFKVHWSAPAVIGTTVVEPEIAEPESDVGAEVHYAAPITSPWQIQPVRDETADYQGDWGVAAEEPAAEPVAEEYDYTAYPAADHDVHYAPESYDAPPAATPPSGFIDSVKSIFRKLTGG